MPQPAVQPIEQWLRPEDEGIYRLQHPTGEVYDPYEVPSWLGQTSLSFLAAHAGLRMSVVYGKRETDADLGIPGEFEDIAADATMLVDDIRGLSPGIWQDISYRQRRAAAMPPNIVTLGLYSIAAPGPDSFLPVVQDAYTARHEWFVATSGTMGEAELEREGAVVTAAEANVVNVTDWRLFAGIDEMLRMLESSGREHIILNLLPTQLDFARKASDILGIRTEAFVMNERAWPTNLIQQSRNMAAILRAGAFRTK